MITLTNTHALELKDTIKRLTEELYEAMSLRNDSFADTEESITSYVVRLDNENLNRSFHNYSSAARVYARYRKNDAH